MAAHSSILAWEIPWTEEAGGYSSWGHKGSDMTEHSHTHTMKYKRSHLLFLSVKCLSVMPRV